MIAGEEQGLEDGGQGGGGEIIEETWEPRVVCLVFNVHDALLSFKSRTSCGPSGYIPVPFVTLMFFPPLDSTVVVDVPPNARSGGVSLLFRARTGSASALQQLKRDGVKVQAWTNALVDNNRAEGTWGSYNFEEAPAATPGKLDDSVVPFSLPPTEDNFVDEPYTLFLTLKLRALPQQQTEAEFLVTYRFLYPNGGIKWLGYQGRDLRCVLKKTDPWLAPRVTAGQSSGNVYSIFSSITMKESWGCWAIGARRSVIAVGCSSVAIAH